MSSLDMDFFLTVHILRGIRTSAHPLELLVVVFFHQLVYLIMIILASFLSSTYVLVTALSLY